MITLSSRRSTQFLSLMALLLVACVAGFGSLKAAQGPGGAAQGAGPAPVDLGSAGDYVILAATGVTNVPTSAITGNIGVSPIAATAITGFSLVASTDNTYSTSAQVTGNLYAADYASPTPANLTSAVGDMEAAYGDAAGRLLPDYTELNDGNIGGLTLQPGLYNWTSTVTIPGDVTLDGGPNDVWIFQIAGDLSQADAAAVVLTGGAQAKNVFWQVAGTVAIGATAHMEGMVLSKTEVALCTGATVNGRLFAQTAVTLIMNTIVEK